MRAVLDPNVLISGLLSARGAPAELIARWRAGAFEMVVSPRLLDELRRVLEHPKVAERVPPERATALVALPARDRADDPAVAPRRAADPDDDYLLALAAAERAVLVSGDRHVLELAGRYPVFSPREFLDRLTT